MVATMVGRQEKFLNSRCFRMAKTEELWSIYLLHFVNDITFSLTKVFIQITRKSSGKSNLKHTFKQLLLAILITFSGFISNNIHSFSESLPNDSTRFFRVHIKQ